MTTTDDELVPSAARLLNGMRAVGYDFTSAVADLVDNSISAGATRVDVTLRAAYQGGITLRAAHQAGSWVRIADNGHGMTPDRLREAMRLGSGGTDYAADDLGKFGLGLKTASLSQARRLVVATRGATGLHARALDLDEIGRSDRWIIPELAEGDIPPEAGDPLRDGSTGTVALWQSLDRTLDFHDPFGSVTQWTLQRLAEALDLHLGMVFGRFLAGTARRREPLAIRINGSEVDAWDPFCLREDTNRLPEKDLPVLDSVVRYRPYVLPAKEEFRSEDAWRRAAGPKKWNNQQGLYIYRSDRLVQSGGWSRLRSTDEHIKLARASVDFWPPLDDAFEVNVSKMSVALPSALRDAMKPLVAFLSKTADDRYRAAAKKPAKPKVAPPAKARPAERTPVVDPPPPSRQGAAPAPTGPPGAQPAGGGQPPERLTGVGRALETAATRAGLDQELSALKAALADHDPGTAGALGW